LTDAPKEDKKTHQVLRYLELVKPFCSVIIEELKLCAKDDKQNLCIINPGAAYGEAKRWSAKKFGEVAVQMSQIYDMAIVGGKDEVKIGEEVESVLLSANVQNYRNLVGKTTMNELIELIASAKLFITNDSGPMHIAAAFKVPTVAVFGPTDDSETSAWGNPKYTIVKKDLKCMPCKKRVCPLKHHDCMRLIDIQDILEAAKKVI
jgi:heptosyltransferase-2